MTSRIAVVGAGLIGRAWAIVFARAGHQVALFDPDPAAAGRALDLIRDSVEDLVRTRLVADGAAVVGRIRAVATLDEAAAEAAHVQENGPETLEVKIALFRELDRIAPKDAVLASSSSAICPSAFTADLAGRSRCLVAHPVNPPYLIPLVEIVPAPWTANAAVERCRTLMKAVGQEPIVLSREIQGFILNRLQGALLNEAFKLAEAGYASIEDIDRTIAHGLGLRWSFMGPFETIDLNAPGGLGDYARRYGPAYFAMAQSQARPQAWSEALVSRLERERRSALPADRLGDRQRWRDRRLMALMAHKRDQEQRETDDEPPGSGSR